MKTDYTNGYPKWDKSMKNTHKILIPNILSDKYNAEVMSRV